MLLSHLGRVGMLRLTVGESWVEEGNPVTNGVIGCGTDPWVTVRRVASQFEFERERKREGGTNVNPTDASDPIS